MALSQDDERDVYARAKDIILKDFQDEFQELYSYAITVLEVAPEQANNEIRNALNHIARALSANDIDAGIRDIEKAKSHIDRAKRDCLKLANIHLHEQIKSDLINIQVVEGSVPLSIKARLTTLEAQGADARRAESLGADDVSDQLASVFSDMKTFRDDLRTQFTVPTNKMTSWMRFWWQVRRHTGVLFLGIAGGIFSSLIAALIYSHYFASNGSPSPQRPAHDALTRPEGAR